MKVCIKTRSPSTSLPSITVKWPIEKSKDSPTRLLRILMEMFFSPETMARSTAKGSDRRGLDALDQTVMESIYSKSLIH